MSAPKPVIRHNHMTRDIKPPYQCPACDRIAHGCPCPRGDIKLGRLYGVDMGIKRDMPLSHDPECPIHPHTKDTARDEEQDRG